MIWLFLLGLAVMSFGLFWLIGGLQGGFFGAGFLFGAGLVMTLCGFGLTMIWLYDRVSKKEAAFSK